MSGGADPAAPGRRRAEACALPRGALFEGTLDLLDRIGIDTAELRGDSRSLVFDAGGLRAGDDAALRRPHLRRGGRRRPRDHRQGRARSSSATAPSTSSLDLGYGALPDGPRRRAGATSSLGEAERRLGAMRIATKYPRIGRALLRGRPAARPR